MSELTQEELIVIRRAAEDAIHAANKHYKPFIEVVAHPLNIIALVDMAVKQYEIDHLNSILDERTNEWLKAIELGDYFKNIAEPLKAELDEKDKRIVVAMSKFDSIISMLATMDMVIVPDEVFNKLDELGDVLGGVTK